METTTNTRYEVSPSEDIFFNDIYYLDFEKKKNCLIAVFFFVKRDKKGYDLVGV